MADTAAKVVDASALVAVLFGEPAGTEVIDQVRGCRLFAPAILDFELANVCISKLRRTSQERSKLITAYEARWAMKIEIVGIDHTAVLALARRTGLTGYDASYLHLARTPEVKLVTLDRQLAAVAEKSQ